jgi:alanyl-tRNA synthetase
MALHSGQHALSRALLDELGAITVSSRLGASACTVDVDRDGLGLDEVRRAEDAVNRLIDEDRPVSQRFVDDEELARLSLRKPPPDAPRIRVVEIDGYDITPCGGTHVTHTAQIELLWIYGVERYKGGTRVTFAAGPRARRMLRGESDALRGVAGEMGCAPPEVGGIVRALRAKLDEARTESGALRARLAEAWTRELEARADEGPIVAALDGADAAVLKAIGQRLAVGERLVVLTGPSEEGTHLLVARGPEADTHAGQLLKRIADAHGGRGGGRPEIAQGRLPPGARVSERDLG